MSVNPNAPSHTYIIFFHFFFSIIRVSSFFLYVNRSIVKWSYWSNACKLPLLTVWLPILTRIVLIMKCWILHYVSITMNLLRHIVAIGMHLRQKNLQNGFLHWGTFMPCYVLKQHVMLVECSKLDWRRAGDSDDFQNTSIDAHQEEYFIFDRS